MKWTRGIVKRKTIWTEGLFTLEVSAPEVAEFEPGQFLQIGIDQEDGHLHRPYSVASPHGEVLDFFIVLVEDGRLTPHLWAMNEGSEVDISLKAAGSFTLQHCPDASTLWLMATGTGLAPYIAMLRRNEAWERYKRIVLIHGVRHGVDLAYQPELASYKQQYGDRFDYVPVVSRESIEGTMSGRITTRIQDGSLEERIQHKFDQDCCVMMCGNPEMLNEAERLLGERGLRKHKRKEPGQIVVERYW
ncbi:MAG: ferredoxin--NADP reductase [Pirellulaceae bacterium]